MSASMWAGLTDGGSGNTHNITINLLGVNYGGAGTSDDPTYDVLVNGQVVGSGTAINPHYDPVDFTYNGGPVTSVEVHYTNDVLQSGSSGGNDLYVDSIIVDGSTYQSERSIGEGVTYTNDNTGVVDGQEGLYWGGTLVFDLNVATPETAIA